MAGALEMAGEIAGRSPVAVQGTKINLVYSRDHSVAEGLNYMVRSLPFFKTQQWRIFLRMFILSESPWSCLYISLH